MGDTVGCVGKREGEIVGCVGPIEGATVGAQCNRWVQKHVLMMLQN